MGGTLMEYNPPHLGFWKLHSTTYAPQNTQCLKGYA